MGYYGSTDSTFSHYRSHPSERRLCLPPSGKVDTVGETGTGLVLFVADTFSRLMYLEVKFHFTEMLLIHCLEGRKFLAHGLMGRIQGTGSGLGSVLTS